MKQPLLIISTVLTALFIIAGVYIFRPHPTVRNEGIATEDEKLKVVTTFYPLGEISRQVGGNKADVSVIVPAGSEPHEYEPTPQDIASMYSADIVVINGSGIDAWATKIRPDMESKGVKVLVMSQILGFDDGRDAAVHEEGDGADPHFWLDPVLAQREAASIENVFKDVDMENRDVYTENVKAYTQVLQDLDRSYRDGLSSCKNKTVVTSHDAFGYLAKRYGFETLSIAGFSPESEPSTRQLADLARLAREKNIRYIFFETLVSPRLAEALASEIGAQTLVFNPLEGLTDEEIAQGKDYVSVMQENLNNLRLAMDCYGE